MKFYFHPIDEDDFKQKADGNYVRTMTFLLQLPRDYGGSSFVTA